MVGGESCCEHISFLISSLQNQRGEEKDGEMRGEMRGERKRRGEERRKMGR